MGFLEGLLIGVGIGLVVVFLVHIINSELEIRKVKRKMEIQEEIYKWESMKLEKKYKR